MPMNTFTAEILRKVSKSQSVGKLNSDQFLLGLLSMPQMWMQVPFIALPDEQISIQYNLPKEHAPYALFFDHQGNYRLLPRLQEIYHRPPAERSTADKNLIKVDERVNIVYQLLNHTMPGIFPHPDDPSHTWYAPGDDLSLFPVPIRCLYRKHSTNICQKLENHFSVVTGANRKRCWMQSSNINRKTTKLP